MYINFKNIAFSYICPKFKKCSHFQFIFQYVTTVTYIEIFGNQKCSQKKCSDIAKNVLVFQICSHILKMFVFPKKIFFCKFKQCSGNWKMFFNKLFIILKMRISNVVHVFRNGFYFFKIVRNLINCSNFQLCSFFQEMFEKLKKCSGFHEMYIF